MASSFPSSPVFSNRKCSGAATKATEKTRVAPAPSGSSKEVGSSFKLNCLQSHLHLSVSTHGWDLKVPSLSTTPTESGT